MDFISSLAKAAQPKPSSDQPSTTDPHEKPASNSDLFGSAKVVADAAQAQFRNEPDKYDKAKVAGAAANLLDAASEYGKLDETKGIGKCVDQAEGYLRQYGAPASGDHKPAAAAAGGSGEGITAEKTTATETTDAEKPSGGEGGDYVKEAEGFLGKESAGGAGDYLKKAEEFLDKKSDGGAQAGGAGDYPKKAEELLSKPSGDGGEKNEASSESGGGYGDLLKAAGGFLNK